MKWLKNKRADTLQKFHQIERAKQRKLNQKHSEYLLKMQKKEELRLQKEKET